LGLDCAVLVDQRRTERRQSGTATVGSTRLGGDDGRLFARPWPVVKLFREFMERNLRPDPVPDAIWNLPATNA
jgi:hypothetical protein